MINPGMAYTQPDPARSRPRCAFAHNVSTPLKPTVARNAKARATPPNCASTLHSDTTVRRKNDSGGRLTISYASTAPRNAPMIAVDPDSRTLFQSAVSAVSVNSALDRSRVNAPSSKTEPEDDRDGRDEQEDATSTKNGTSGKPSRTLRPMPFLAMPGSRCRSADALAQLPARYFASLALFLTDHGRLTLDLRQRAVRRLVDGAGLTMASARIGRAPPPSHRFWPSSL